MLDIYIDFKSPAAYLAQKPTRALLAKYPDAKIDWHPFRTLTRDTIKRGDNESIAQSHKRVRAQSRRRLFLKYADIQGIDMRFPEHRIGTDLALGALAEIKGDRLPFIAACFNAYWTAHANLDDTATITALLKQSNAAHNGDLTNAHKNLASATADAETKGVLDTPCYRIKDAIFIGREHLPTIAELLSPSSCAPLKQQP